MNARKNSPGGSVRRSSTTLLAESIWGHLKANSPPEGVFRDNEKGRRNAIAAPGGPRLKIARNVRANGQHGPLQIAHWKQLSGLRRRAHNVRRHA